MAEYYESIITICSDSVCGPILKKFSYLKFNLSEAMLSMGGRIYTRMTSFVKMFDVRLWK